MEQKYKLNDGIYIFRSCDKHTLIIRNYNLGICSKVKYQNKLYKLLLQLTTPKSIDELNKVVSNISKSKIIDIITVLKRNRIVVAINENKKLNVLLIGLGTSGSHIASQLAVLSNIEEMVLVDRDTVEYSNINRQNYYYSDIGIAKGAVIRSRFPEKKIIVFDEYVDSPLKIKSLIQEKNIDIAIMAADYPSTRTLALWTEKVCNDVNIPYIIVFGYIDSAIALPEFYFPNNDYSFSYKHEINNEEFLFKSSNKKPSFISASCLGLVVARQLIDYSQGKTPIYYKKRGFLYTETLEWKVDEVE